VIGSRASKRAGRQQAQGAQQAADIALGTAREVAPGISTAAEEAATGVLGASERAAGDVLGATGEGTQTLRDIYEQIIGAIEPYGQAGTEGITQLSDLLQPGGEFHQRFSLEDFEADPGYQFRQREGAETITRNAGLRGMARSGQTAKALTRFGQDLASQEYQRAYDRFNDDRTRRFAMLADMVNVGQRATGQGLDAGSVFGRSIADLLFRGSAHAGDTRMRGSIYAGDARQRGAATTAGVMTDAARTAGQAYTGAGSARAAGTVGSGSAWGRMLGGLGQIGIDVGDYYTLQDLMRRGQLV
jgi:hypothetical protein